MNVFRPIQIEWAWTAISALEKDGMLRYCVNYRNFNAVTVRRAYLLSEVYESTNFLLGAEVLSTLHAKRRNSKIEVSKADWK